MFLLKIPNSQLFYAEGDPDSQRFILKISNDEWVSYSKFQTVPFFSLTTPENEMFVSSNFCYSE